MPRVIGQMSEGIGQISRPIGQIQQRIGRMGELIGKGKQFAQVKDDWWRYACFWKGNLSGELESAKSRGQSAR